MRPDEPIHFAPPESHAQSAFLRFVADEFHKRGTPLRYELASKIGGAKRARQAGIATAHRIAGPIQASDIDLKSLPRRFVIKPMRGWSARGVKILDRIGEDLWFDHLSQREYPRDGVLGPAADEEDGWLVEDLIASSINGKIIPFDYKFYCFRDRIGVIVQIDRNLYPPRISLFDGNFMPLLHGADYLIRSDKAEPGNHVIPRHAPELRWWAKKLSMLTDSPFVSIDLFDGRDGPVFGEFTFSPGGTHKRLWVYSHELLAALERAFDPADLDERAPADRKLRRQRSRAGIGI